MVDFDNDSSCDNDGVSKPDSAVIINNHGLRLQPCHAPAINHQTFDDSDRIVQVLQQIFHEDDKK